VAGSYPVRPFPSSPLQPKQEKFHQQINVMLTLPNFNWCCHHRVQVGACSADRYARARQVGLLLERRAAPACAFPEHQVPPLCRIPCLARCHLCLPYSHPCMGFDLSYKTWSNSRWRWGVALLPRLPKFRPGLLPPE
jgi:hypothetical protein